ncbi:class I adenylate-forming enzyme family protein [Allosphingosinicella indica]|uniref:Acyl-CoA synthetase (AMP-forming)/AMP-acid ligase II n=1 Tax=Allosphingosinicella indica TaxID=941907 RepID=A0A1X7G0N5_9SPHN|nr:class I adenylate-forming enzyme family protein [Allosphingosinicella indica]SMF61924.1 Acyl-CoA synthetase (AMP-forming)/AMP-acid ligase II [Allosphingosinicella indica]
MQLTPQQRIDDFTARGWWGDLTLDHLLQRNRAEVGERLALVDPMNRTALDGHAPRRLTWAELGEEVDRVGAALLGLGLVKDDILTYQTPNFVDTVVLALACSRIGLIISPVVMPYRAHELGYVLDTVRPKALVTVARFAGHDHAAMALELCAARDCKVLVLGGDAPAGAVDLEAAIAKADPAVAAAYHDAQPTQPGEVYTIFWTSGTEARPKGVPRDQNHWIVNAEMVTEAADIREGEVLLNPFPLVNIGSFGLVTPWLLNRGTLVLHHPFDLPVFLGQIAAEKVNYTIAAPAILNALLKTPGLLDSVDLSSLRAIGSGSAPLSPWMIEGFADRYGIEVCNIYGSNEGASLFSDARQVPDHHDRARFFPRMGVKGIDWPGSRSSAMIQTRLIDLDSETEITEPGRPGELRFQGAATFGGYWENPEVTANAFDADGFYRTGDLFEIAGDGPDPRFYRFVGRCKDIIVRGGVNISPAEIDDLLAGHPELKEAAVVGLPDERLGERMCVAAVPQEGAAPTLDAITSFLADQGVAVFKLPEQIVIVDALPRNAMNKVSRRHLRETVIEMLAG